MTSAIIAGLDEAGRGALAGPVVAAACIFEKKRGKMPRIDDSKKLTKEQREQAHAFITENFSFGIGIIDALFIDENGVLAATEKAMQDALDDLRKKVEPTYLLIDGRDHFWFDIPHSSVIRGDSEEKCIAAASILAKVERDRLMEEFDAEFPGYGFSEHKGYGTEQHFESLRNQGLSPLHRQTFLRKMTTVQKPSGAFSAR